MKKILTILSLMLLVMAMGVLAGKPVKDECTTIQDGILETSGGELIPMGFMDNGYNYQAHLFNGLWGQDKLVMKWNDAWLSNKDCDTQIGEGPFTGEGPDGKLDRHLGFDSYSGSGAWLTNHFSGDYTELDVSGDWVLEFDYNGGKYVHDMTIDSSFEGIGAAQFSAQTWIVSGDVTGNLVDFTIFYDNSGYEVSVLGIIAADGTMSGDWQTNTGQTGTWVSLNGSALVACHWTEFIKIVAPPLDAESVDGIWYTADGTEIGSVIWGAFALTLDVWNDPCAGMNGVYYKGTPGFGLY